MNRNQTLVPVTADPHPTEVRQAIAEMIRDFHPAELRSFTVQPHSDGATVHAWIFDNPDLRVSREVYFGD